VLKSFDLKTGDWSANFQVLLAGITFPSGEVQKQLLQDVYAQACVDPSSVAYVEAHGTGTKAGDPQEVNTITDVFCKGRQGPLLIGSTKSNMGHPEPASGNSFDIFCMDILLNILLFFFFFL